MHFLFMDESFGDPKRNSEPVVLTGVMVPAANHGAVLSKYLELFRAIFQPRQGVVEPQPDVHAVGLFKNIEADDEQRLLFFKGIVDLLLGLKLEIYRAGYFATPEALRLFNRKDHLLGLCLLDILSIVTERHPEKQIWPVMEMNASDRVQDLQFAGMVRSLSYYGDRVGKENVSIKYDNLGELLYSSKRSNLGSIVDCVAYLRQAKEQRERGAVSEFKKKLADIGALLEPSISFERVTALLNSKGDGGN